jgi:LysM repeat protein
MNRYTYLRTFSLLACIAIAVVGLTSCQLPASTGPETTIDGQPLPSEATSSGIDVSSFATQTAQALPSYVTITPLAPPNTSESPAAPTATPVPAGPVAPAPTETSVVYVVATAGPPPATYTLAQGEFPFCIARRFNVDINELLSINGLSSSSYTYAGQVLKLPQTGNPFVGERALKPHPDYYQIKSGDTLNTIACSYGDVSPDMIAMQNGLTEGNYGPGDVIIIP